MFLYLGKSHGLLWELLLMGVSLAADCPPMCMCDIFKVNCRSKGLNAFPKSLPLSTRYLDLSDNSISEINSLELNLLSDLVHLDCSYNAISEISSLDFLAGMKLVYLDISYNALKKIGSTTFERLTRLIVLKLNNNKIQEVHQRAFESNIGLRVLDLRNNSLSFLNVSLIKRLHGLKSVYLSGNPWECQCTIKLLSQWLMESKSPKIRHLAVEKEAQAIVEAAQHWRHYLADNEDTVCSRPKSMVGIPVSEALSKIFYICVAPLDYFDYIFFVMVGFTIFISGIIVASIVGLFMVCLERHRMVTGNEDDIEMALYQRRTSVVRSSKFKV
ncbi:leucine-rich repeat-containing protein 52-like isoform X2 [Narcine bancroftii]|uniref:leucine-rich repeat-containing protein 52-like isoform X2 n=1 Tax=Narcine bancroftii TaxID=1343680 RepID=UPI003831C273